MAITVDSLDNGVGRRPPMGYSSWNDCASQVTEKRIKNITTHMINTGLALKGFIHINVDDGWLLKRNATNGNLIEDRTKFPSGMKALGDWIHDQVVPGAPGDGKIMKYGLYTCRGTCQCGTKEYSGPGGHGYEHLDAAWLANAGADYLKVDSCCGSQDHATAFADYSKWRDGLNSTGREIYFSLCGWHTWYAEKGDSLGNSWRIAGDGTNWGALTNCINSNVPLQQYARPGAWNDPDLLQGTGVGSNDKATNPSGCFDGNDIPQAKGWYQSEHQSRAQFSMWSIMSAPLLISADVGQVTPYSLETWSNEEVIAISQQFRHGGPYQGERLAGGDMMYQRGEGGGEGEGEQARSSSNATGSGTNVWGKKLPNDSFALVFVSNENDVVNVTCNSTCLSDIIGDGMTVGSSDGTYEIRDVWSHTTLATKLSPPYDSFTATELEPHGGVAMYRFTPSQALPLL